MEPELPKHTPEQQAFGERIARFVPSLLKATNDLSESIKQAVYLAADEMRSEGYDEKEIAPLREDALKRCRDEDDQDFVSQALQSKLVDTFLQEGGEPPAQYLIEKVVETKTGFRMFIWPNESKHPGNPHVTVKIDDHKFNVSICENPEVIAGSKSIRGVSAVLKAVKLHREDLLREWDEMRPDDQKIENFKKKAPS